MNTFPIIMSSTIFVDSNIYNTCTLEKVEPIRIGFEFFYKIKFPANPEVSDILIIVNSYGDFISGYSDDEFNILTTDGDKINNHFSLTDFPSWILIRRNV